MLFGLDYDTELTPTAATDKEKTASSQTDTSSLSVPNVSTALKVFCPAKFHQPRNSGSTTLLSSIMNFKHPQEFVRLCRVVSGTAIFQGMLSVLALSTLRIDMIAPTQYRLEVLSCFPSNSFRAAVFFMFFIFHFTDGLHCLPLSLCHRDRPCLATKKITHGGERERSRIRDAKVDVHGSKREEEARETERIFESEAGRPT